MVVMLAIALGVAAYLNPGLIQADVHLDEGTVYAGNRGASLVGTLNTQIDSLSDAAPIGDTSFNIMQHDDLVLVHSTESDRLARYNPGTNSLSLPTQLPSKAQVRLVGTNLLVVNPVDGRAWAGPAETLLEYDFDKQQADLEIGENGVATLTTSGKIIGLDPNRSVLVRPGEDGEEVTELPFTTNPQSVMISAVGERALVLDRSVGRIWLEGMPKAFDVSGASGAQLMAPAADALGGEDGTRAIYATQAGLIALTSDGPRSLSGQMDATAVTPIQVNGCVYAAFGDQFVRKCVGQEVHIEPIPKYPDNAELAFQSNRSSVILNDLEGGTIWLVNENMKIVNNWEDVTPERQDKQTEDPDVHPFVPRERDEDNHAPIAKDDQLKARAGRSTVLTVLDNDTDPDGDVLTISAPQEVSGARLSPVRNGAGLQISIASDASGTVSFTYEISDGREGGKASAKVEVEILPLDPSRANSLPHKFEMAKDVTISQRQIFTKQALLDWRDPDGDPLMLKNAWLDEGSEDRVAFTADGTLTFTDIGKTTGPKVVHLLVSDGYGEQEGTLNLDVSPDAVAPVAYGDFATSTVGESVEIEPIANDVGYSLRLSEVTTDCDRCTLTPNYPEDKFTFVAPQAGTYYLTYTVRSAEPATGIVRVDVRPDRTGTPPIAALDVAMLPPGGSVTIDPLLNDTDADGDVLVIQTVSQQPALSVVLERRHLVTISANSHPSEPITLEYRVSDGHHSVIGHIVVIPAETTGTTKPQPKDDSIAVRAGNTVSANVLNNDESPIGLDLKITRLLRNPLGDDAWVDGDQIRLRSPEGALATSTSLDYEVMDSDGRTGVATVQVEVSAEDSNAAAPQPRKIVDRVLSGTTTRIPIDLTGIDPAGSSVRLVGIASGPSLGRVTEVGEKYLTYESFSDSQGTDIFQYEVINRMGMRATGQLRIGVAPPGAQNTPPTGVVDEVRVKPGRHVQLAALSNDFDLDGDTLAYSKTDPVRFQDAEIKASIVGDREVVLTAPEEPGTYAGSYGIVDGRGQQGRGSILVTVDPDAPLQAPVTRDDTVSGAAILEKEWVEVDVLANDYDPDGAQESLRIEVPDYDGDNATARVSSGRKVTVKVLDQMQQVRYKAIDADGNASYGVITIPGRGDSVPVLRDQNVELEAVAGQPLTFDLNTYVVGTQSREVRLTTADNISATQGSAAPDGPASVRYLPDALYEGPASVVFEVTDQVAEGDTTAKTAFISIKVKVLPAPDQAKDDAPLANEPPKLVVENPTLQVAPGEGEERLDLASLFRDPEGQDVYVDDLTAQAGDNRISWRLDGGMLAASAAIDTPASTTRTLSGVAYDASTGSTPFTVQIVVTSSRRPLTQTVDDHVPEAAAGVPVDINVLSNDVSFLSDKSLTVINAQVVSGAATISHTADGVTIKPTSGTNGTIIARYTVQDATKDTNRNVDGRITVEVQDKPAQPLTPYPEGVGDGEVTVTYASGGDGGRPVTRRIATATSPGEATVVQDCPGERCTVTGLRNGRPWSVSIVEVNELGRSEPSPQSAPQTPDAKPLPPSRPTVKYGDRSLTLNWSHNPKYSSPLGGSPIRGYHISLLDSSGTVLGTQSVSGSSRSYTWTGLDNGTPYSFRVTAENEHKTSDPSPDSVAESPSGPPQGGQELGVKVIENEIGGGFEVTFNASRVNANGAPITSYLVVPVTKSGEIKSKTQKVGASSGTVTVTVTGMGTQPTRFKLLATNRSGTAEVGASSEYQISYKVPKVTSIVGQPGDGILTYKVKADADPGAPLVVEYNIGDGWRELGDGVIRNLTNGQSYTVAVRARVNHLVSAEVKDSPKMPKTAKPRDIPWDSNSMLLTSNLDVSIPAPTMSMTDSGGWDPSKYTWCTSTTGCQPNQFGRASRLTLKPGASNTIHWRWNNQHSGNTSIDVQGVQQPTYTSGRLKFRLPYVQTGSCEVSSKISDNRGRVYDDRFTVYVSNRTISYDEELVDDDEHYSVQSIQVNCRYNGVTKTFKPK